MPHDLPAAQHLFEKDPFEFERWAVAQLNGQPNEKQVGDKGSDGTIYFPLTKAKRGRIAVSVKEGQQLKPGMVRDLIGTLEPAKAQMGVLVTLNDPTKGMVQAANTAGTYTWEATGQSYPKVQIITAAQLLDPDFCPDLPPAYRPYTKGTKLVEPVAEQESLFG